MIAVPVFGEKSQFEALTPKEKKVLPPKETKNGAGDTRSKSSIPRPQKRESSKKQKPTLAIAVSEVCFFASHEECFKHKS